LGNQKEFLLCAIKPNNIIKSICTSAVFFQLIIIQKIYDFYTLTEYTLFPTTEKTALLTMSKAENSHI